MTVANCRTRAFEREALETGATPDEREALFRGVFSAAGSLRWDVRQILDTLVEARLATTAGNER